jgi:SMI1 / KNR4 family (SUKH-1)
MPRSPSSIAAWIHRAESFVRQLNYLPGQWGVSIAVDPPATSSQVDEVAKTLPFGLPESLREIYANGAARCRCRYYWTPDDEHVVQLDSVFPHQRSFGGGASFVPLANLLDAHDVHTWWNGYGDMPAKGQAAMRDRWRHTIPFIDVGNGDYVALQVTQDPGTMPVIYLCHDDEERPITLVSPSLDQFLQDWETLHYVGPEIWLLSAFLSNDGLGPLDVEQDNVRQLREILKKK